MSSQQQITLDGATYVATPFYDAVQQAISMSSVQNEKDILQALQTANLGSLDTSKEEWFAGEHNLGVSWAECEWYPNDTDILTTRDIASALLNSDVSEIRYIGINLRVLSEMRKDSITSYDAWIVVVDKKSVDDLNDTDLKNIGSWR